MTNTAHDIKLMIDMVDHMKSGAPLDSYDRRNLEEIRDRHGIGGDDSMIDASEAQAQWEDSHGLYGVAIDGIDPNHPFSGNPGCADY